MTTASQDIGNLVSNRCVNVGGVWRLEGAADFPYSDGEVENTIHDAIAAAQDISVQSRELEQHIVDWPTKYHLSRERSLAYWPLNIGPGMKVLEVGSGCGAITRFLGERGCEVLAVEGSANRARITRQRTRDLPNVAVLCAPFQQIEYRARFDLIVCNGVFEYSALFVPGDDPYEAILDTFRANLSERGALLVAIENQLGLRYFSSSTEDHTGIMFDGIEDYPRHKKGAHTFGYTELRAMLGRRFSDIEALFPLADYKLPSAIVRERLLALGDCAELFASVSNGVHGSSSHPLFHERLAWRPLARNGLIPHFANSLIFVCSNGDSGLLREDWLASIYSLRRHAAYTTSTTVRQGPQAQVVVDKQRWEPASTAPPAPGELRHHCGGTQAWVDGPSLHTVVADILCEAGGAPLRQRLAPAIERWWQAVGASGPAQNLPPDRLDAVWNNTVISGGKARLIDAEWAWAAGVPPSWLIFRAVSMFVRGEMPHVHRWSGSSRRLTERQLAREVAAICGVPMSDADFSAALGLETRLHALVAGQPGDVQPRWTTRWQLGSVSIGRRQKLERLRAKLARVPGALKARLGLA